MPVRNVNCRGAWKVSELAMRSAARRRVRKSRGEQDESRSRHAMQRTKLDVFRINERGLGSLILDCKQYRSLARRERMGSDLAFEVGGPAARDRGFAIGAMSIRR